MDYFTLPMLGTPYNRYFLLEEGVVVSVDISRPDGREVPYQAGARFNLRVLHKRDGQYVHADTVRRVSKGETVTRNRTKKDDEPFSY